jgi:Zn-dependent protease
LDSERDELFDATRSVLQAERPSRRQGRRLPLIMFAVFAASLLFVMPIFDLVCIVVVLLIHEAGHYFGMRVLGYTDLRILFIPFFGGAVSGVNRGTESVTKEVIVLLLGPTPGLLSGIAWFWFGTHHPQIDIAAWWLIVLNGFNLLPLMPLDGGRLLNLILFSRHYLLEIAFLVLTSLALIFLSWYLNNYFLALIGACGLVTVPMRYRMARLATRLRQHWVGLPSGVQALTREQQRILWDRIAETFPKDVHQIGLMARRIDSLHRMAHVKPLSLPVSSGLMLLYITLILMGLVSLGIGPELIGAG